MSVAWIAVISSTPFVGAAAYLLFGERRLGPQRAARIAACIVQVRHWQEGFRESSDSSTLQVDALAEPIRRQAEAVLGNATPTAAYEPGTWGPAEADRLTADVGGWAQPS